jgi:EmrB/QacA subfamily drug resistance transporter
VSAPTHSAELGSAPGVRTATLLLLCVAQFLVALDFSIVNIALPTMQDALGFSATGIGWVVSAYAVVFGGLLLVGGRAADLFGRRRMFMSGLVVFGVASVLGGMASTALQVVVARVGQAIGAALLLPAALALLATLFADPSARTRALGTLGGVGAAGAAAGVLVGGLLTEALGWRWVFFANVPIVAIALALAPVLLARRQTRPEDAPLDLAGALLGTSALLLLLYGFEETLVVGWLAPRGGGLVLAALVLLAVFVAVERRVPAPVLPLALVARRSIAGANVVAALSAGTFMPSLVLLSQYMQQALGLAPFVAGLAFLPLTVATLLSAGVWSGRLTDAVGCRRASLIGLVLLGVGYGLLARLAPGDHYARDVLPGMLFTAAGAGLMFTVVISAALADVDIVRHGAASAMVSSSRQIGSAVGAAVMIGLAADGGYDRAYGVAILAVLAGVVVTWLTLPSAARRDR